MCNLSQVATGARYLKGVNRVLLKSNMCSIWGATETTSQQRADEANSNERGGGQRTSNSWRGEVNAAKWKLAWKPRIRVFKRAQWRKIRKSENIPNCKQNSYINSRQVIAKKVSIPLEKLSFLQQVWPISVEIRALTRKPHWLLG